MIVDVPREQRRLFCEALAVYLVAQVFYLLTLAPTVLWGDDSRFQRMAYLLDLGVQRLSDHPLWIALAHPFAHLPGLEPACGTNLFTSLWGALTVALAYVALRRWTSAPWAALGGAGSLLVSHTFWTHAVRTEVYSLNLALLAAALCVLSSPRLRWEHLALSSLMTGLALLNHVMMLAVLPGVLLLAIWRMRQQGLGAKSALPAVALLLVSLTLLPMVIPSGGGKGFALADYVPTASGVARESIYFLAYWGLQFPSPALLLGLFGAWRAVRRPPWGWALWLVLIANVGVALNYQVADKYAFYLPAYLVGALWVGLGLEELLTWLHRRRRATRALIISLLLAILALPVASYASAPLLLPRLGITAGRLGIREIPGRPALRYFLWPSKRGYKGARRFAERALQDLPAGAVLLADDTVAEPIIYLQKIEGLRPDVRVADLPLRSQVGYALAVHKQGHAIYLALTEPYYDIAGLSAHFCIVPQGTVYRLDARAP